MLVQKLRLQRGWSQEQLAEVAGVSVRTIQRLERGQPGSLKTLKALWPALGWAQASSPTGRRCSTPCPS